MKSDSIQFSFFVDFNSRKLVNSFLQFLETLRNYVRMTFKSSNSDRPAFVAKLLHFGSSKGL